jgi:hypothetical protein
MSYFELHSEVYFEVLKMLDVLMSHALVGSTTSHITGVQNAHATAGMI